jgi:hypothetical protein
MGNSRRHGHRLLTTLVVGAVAAAGVTVAAARPADAATKVTFTGGQIPAPYGAAATPSVSSNGRQALVVWSENVGGTVGVYGRITSADTTSIGNRITIRSTAGHDSVLPDVAWIQELSTWQVVWEYAYSADDHDILAASVRHNGSVSAAFGVETSSADQCDPAIAGPNSGTDSEVAYEQGRVNDPLATDIWSRRIGTDGAYPAVRRSYDTTADPFNDKNPDVARRSGGGLVVVWDAQSSTTSEIQAWREGGLNKFVASGPWYTPRTAPAIAAGPENTFMVAYEYDRGGAQAADIEGVLESPSGYARFDLSVQPRAEREPAIAFNGAWLVAWRDRRNDLGGDIYGTRVPYGALGYPDENSFLITRFTPEDDHPALSSGTTAADSFVAAWEATPSGKGPGVVAYGMTLAPK